MTLRAAPLWSQSGAWMLRSKVLLAALIGLSALLSHTIAAKACDPNERFVTDPDGKKFLELRWPMGAWNHLVKLRVPAEDVLEADTGCQSAVLPGYPDPNYTQGYASGFTVGMSLPDFKPARKVIPRMFGMGLDWSGMRIQIHAETSRPGHPFTQQQFEQAIQKEFNASVSIFLNPESYAMIHAGLTGAQKPDRYGLKRIGAVGNMERYKTEIGGGAAEDFYYPDHHPLDFWIMCQASEIKDYEEDPSWHRRPPCDMTFRARKISSALDVSFPRIYMTMWKKIKSNSEALVDSFQITKLTDGEL